MLVDHLFQCRISPWPKTAEKRVFCTDGRTDGRTDRRTDRPSYRDAFLTDASKNELTISGFLLFSKDILTRLHAKFLTLTILA